MCYFIKTSQQIFDMRTITILSVSTCLKCWEQNLNPGSCHTKPNLHYIRHNTLSLIVRWKIIKINVREYFQNQTECEWRTSSFNTDFSDSWPRIKTLLSWTYKLQYHFQNYTNSIESNLETAITNFKALLI